MGAPNGATVVGRFVELVPHRRLVFTYGWEDGRLGVPPGRTTVEITSPRTTAPDHQRGWTYFLGILRDALSA
jgi:uncharacterized protein YndB with AHSA1/START domain